MAVSVANVFTTKNWNLVIGLVVLYGILWGVASVQPDLFVKLFYTLLGNAVLFIFIALAGIYNLNFGIGLGVMFMLLYKFANIKLEQFII